MELKWKKNLEKDVLGKLADEALVQISDRRYDVQMARDGIKNILKIGIDFSGKSVCVESENSNISI